MSDNQLNEIAKSLNKFHSLVPKIITNKTVKYNKVDFRYADLPSILDVVRKLLSECGMSIIQTFNGSELMTTLLHESGQKISSSVSLGISPNVDHKQLGAAITYMRRYAISAMLNLSAEEDEAEGAEDSIQLQINSGISTEKLNHLQELLVNESVQYTQDLLNFFKIKMNFKGPFSFSNLDDASYEAALRSIMKKKQKRMEEELEKSRSENE